MLLTYMDTKCFQSEVAASLRGWYMYSKIQQLHTNLCIKSVHANLLITETRHMFYKTKYNVCKTVSMEHVLCKGVLYYFNTFTAKVDHGRFMYLRFNLPESTLVGLKFTLLFWLK
jgi:hypothetical protein